MKFKYDVQENVSENVRCLKWVFGVLYYYVILYRVYIIDNSGYIEEVEQEMIETHRLVLFVSGQTVLSYFREIVANPHKNTALKI